MRGDLLGRMGKQQARCITARRSLPAGARSEFAQSLRSFAGSLPARRGARSEFAQSLRSFAGSLSARRGGPAKLWCIKELRGSESRYSVLGEQAS